MMKQILTEESLKASLSEDNILIGDKPGGCINIMLCQVILIRPCSSLQSWKLTFYISRIQHLMWKVKVKVAELCPTLCYPMDLVHGTLQARILEWVAFPFSRGSSQPRDQTQGSPIAGGFFTSWATKEAQCAPPKCSCPKAWDGHDDVTLTLPKQKDDSELPSKSLSGNAELR